MNKSVKIVVREYRDKKLQAGGVYGHIKCDVVLWSIGDDGEDTSLLLRTFESVEASVAATSAEAQTFGREVASRLGMPLIVEEWEEQTTWTKRREAR